MDSKYVPITSQNEIKLGLYLYGQKVWYKQYKPKPLQCTICLMHGHTKNNCKQTIPVCPQCGRTGHNQDAFTAREPYCKNCKTYGHSSLQKQICPSYEKRAVIVRLSDQMRLPYSVVAARIPNSELAQRLTTTPGPSTLNPPKESVSQPHNRDLEGSRGTHQKQ